MEWQSNGASGQLWNCDCVLTVHMGQARPSLLMNNIHHDYCENHSRGIERVELDLRGFGKIDVGFLLLLLLFLATFVVSLKAWKKRNFVQKKIVSYLTSEVKLGKYNLPLSPDNHIFSNSLDVLQLYTLSFDVNLCCLHNSQKDKINLSAVEIIIFK